MSLQKVSRQDPGPNSQIGAEMTRVESAFASSVCGGLVLAAIGECSSSAAVKTTPVHDPTADTSWRIDESHTQKRMPVVGTQVCDVARLQLQRLLVRLLIIRYEPHTSLAPISHKLMRHQIKRQH